MANENEDTTRDDGTQRKAHYGAGKQPWDFIKEAGWGPAFAAGNVLKYMNRPGKDPAHNLESAFWYWDRLDEMIANREDMAMQRAAMDAKRHLMGLLTDEQFVRLRR